MLLLQPSEVEPTEVELGLQVGVEFDNKSVGAIHIMLFNKEFKCRPSTFTVLYQQNKLLRKYIVFLGIRGLSNMDAAIF